MSGFTNFAGKTTIGDVGKVLEPAAAWSRPLTNFGGFVTGTAASVGGAWATDKLIGHNISNEPLRNAVDGFGGGMTGVIVDAGAQKVLPKVAAKVAPVISDVAKPILEKAAPILEKAAPVLGKVASAAEPVAGALGKVARIGGPAGAVLAGIPDGISAYKNFSHGDTAEGWKSVGRATVKVGFTAAGAALGSAFIPIPGVGTVVGAVVGGFAGDWVAKLF